MFDARRGADVAVVEGVMGYSTAGAERTNPVPAHLAK
jgi:cobyrinic acid a,c-diamide synthase